MKRGSIKQKVVPRVRCYYSGTVLGEMLYPNFTRTEVMEAERGKDKAAVLCPACCARRRPAWVHYKLGGGILTGTWQWKLIFPYHDQLIFPRKESK